MEIPNSFETPKNNRVRSLIGRNGSMDSPGRKITVPSSPYLERLGYGTGK
jgi:hypothetical protein